MSFGTDPFGFGNATAWSPSQAQFLQTSQYQNATQAAQQAYQSGMLSLQNDQLAFQKAQQAFSDAMSMGNAYGYAPGGNWLTWGAGGPTQPLPGTSPLSAQSQWFNQAQQAAGMTGYFNNPQTWTYQPGTFVYSDSSQGGNGAIGQVMPNGTVRQLTSADAQAMGYQQNLAQPLSGSDFYNMATGQPGEIKGQGTNQLTLQAQQQYAQMAAAQAGVTGVYQAPDNSQQYLQQQYAQGVNQFGETWQGLPQSVRDQYVKELGGNVQAAMQQWAQQSSQQDLAAGYTPTNTGATGPQASLQLQQMYGQYGLPTAGQSTLAAQQQAWQQQYQTAQFGLQAQGQQQQAAQQYLQLLSQLQGPADYGQYLKVLGSTPGGLQGLVGAAAGNYVPGGGVSGTAPQAQTLQNLLGAATGYGGGGTGASTAAPPSQPSAQQSTGGPQYSGQQPPSMPGATTVQSGTLPSWGNVPTNWNGANAGQQGYGPQYSGQQPPTQPGMTTATSGMFPQLGSVPNNWNGANAGAANQQQPGSGTASAGGMNYQDFLATAQGLPPPSQIAPQSFNYLNPSQRQMLGSMYANIGYSPTDINSMYQMSLPKYAAGSAAGSFKLV
jgi:hypothetical protein